MCLLFVYWRWEIVGGLEMVGWYDRNFFELEEEEVNLFFVSLIVVGVF